MYRALAAALLMAAFAVVPARGESPVLYGLVGYPSGFTRLDPATLRPVGHRIPTGGHSFAWSFSPDRSRAVAGSDGTGELRFFDLRAMRYRGDAELGVQGLVLASMWAGPSRIVAVVVSPGCCGLGETTVVGLDPTTRKVGWRRVLGGSYQDGARFRRSFVLVLGPKTTVGGSQLAVVGPDGSVRRVALPAIRSGIHHSGRTPETYRSDIWNPGLAIDPAGRAFVVQAGAPVAEVDLRTLRVRMHVLPRTTLAVAKADSGPTRSAVWLGGDVLAVTGSDAEIFTDSRGQVQQRERAAGLKLVDTRKWSARTLDAGTSRIAQAGSTLLAFGIQWDSSLQKLIGDGLRGYDLRGGLRFHRYAGEPISSAQPFLGRALVGGAHGSSIFKVAALLDLRTGKELRRVNWRTTPILRDEAFWY